MILKYKCVWTLKINGHVIKKAIEFDTDGANLLKDAYAALKPEMAGKPGADYFIVHWYFECADGRIIKKEEELPLCPFCGKPAVHPVWDTDGAYPSCECFESDYADGPIHFDVWKSRPIEDALRSRIAKLEARAAELEHLIMNWYTAEPDSGYSEETEALQDEAKRLVDSLPLPKFGKEGEK